VLCDIYTITDSFAKTGGRKDRKNEKHEADHSPPFSAEVKNAWGFYLNSPIRLQDGCLIKYPHVVRVLFVPIFT
jgi:hypothetical protein